MWRHDLNDVMHRKRAQRILGVLKKSVTWVESCLGRRRLTFTCSPKPDQRPCVGCALGLGQMEKSGVSLSLCRKTFKLKGNKKFRTWTKKSWVFFVFRDSYVLRIYVMNILCTFHISVSGYGTKRNWLYFYTLTLLFFFPVYKSSFGYY